MNLKTNKGITLIALVITIIVLLILAGVTISMVLGDDGIITNATKAKEETEKMEYPERVRMAVASALVAGKGKVDTHVYTEEEIEEMLTESAEKQAKNNSIQFALEKEFGAEFEYTEEEITVGDRKFKVDKKGKVTEEEKPKIVTVSFDLCCGREPLTIETYEGWTWGQWFASNEFDHKGLEKFADWDGNGFSEIMLQDSNCSYANCNGGGSCACFWDYGHYEDRPQDTTLEDTVMTQPYTQASLCW